MALPNTVWIDNGLSNVTRTFGQVINLPIGGFIVVPLGDFRVAFDPNAVFTTWEDYSPDQ